MSQGCTEANPGLANCESSRGYIFASNTSTSWSTQRLANGGLYQLNTFEEGFLGLTGNAYYGFDTISLGDIGSGLPNLPNQLVAGFATNSFWLGSLGLSPKSFNFTTLDNPIQSLLSNLYLGGHIPSLSWAYTAGAHYQNPAVLGSLTLGGYDTTRFARSKTLSNLAFGADFSRDLLVGLQAISYNTDGSSPLLTENIDIFIDSLVTQLWLPLSVCQAFEQAFNLTWNSTAQLYLLDDDVHAALVAQNPTFTLTLGSAGGGGSTVDIILPYSAFDLEIDPPLVNSTSRYFPLKQAQNSSQYTLGRVFLQEAYVIADYGNQNFSISQTLFPSTSVAQNLTAILPPGYRPPESKKSHSALSSGDTAGIAVGAVFAFALIIVGVVLAWRRSLRRKKDAAVTARASEKNCVVESVQSETDSRESGRHELNHDSHTSRPELVGDGKLPDGFARYGVYEMAGPEPQEIGAKDVAAVELEGSSR